MFSRSQDRSEIRAQRSVTGNFPFNHAPVRRQVFCEVVNPDSVEL